MTSVCIVMATGNSTGGLYLHEALGLEGWTKQHHSGCNIQRLRGFPNPFKGAAFTSGALVSCGVLYSWR